MTLNIRNMYKKYFIYILKCLQFFSVIFEIILVVEKQQVVEVVNLPMPRFYKKKFVILVYEL